jgi:hypothetical protein
MEIVVISKDSSSHTGLGYPIKVRKSPGIDESLWKVWKEYR